MTTQADRFARCVKQITKNFKPSKFGKKTMKRTDKESAAIAICTKSILWPQGRTLKKFYMKGKKPILITQKMLKPSRK